MYLCTLANDTLCVKVFESVLSYVIDFSGNLLVLDLVLGTTKENSSSAH